MNQRIKMVSKSLICSCLYRGADGTALWAVWKSYEKNPFHLFWYCKHKHSWDYKFTHHYKTTGFFFLDNLSLKQSDLSMLLFCKFLVLKQTLFLILVFHKSVFQHPSSFHLHRWNNQMTDCKWLGLEARLVDVFSVFRYLGTDVDQLPLSQYANGVN